jgi:hypothetical protein
VQEFFDAEIKKLKLKPYYFPLFVTENVLQKEKDHIEGFAPEVCLLLFPSHLHFQIFTVRIQCNSDMNNFFNAVMFIGL